MIVKELFAKLGIEVDEAAFKVGESAIGALKGGFLGLGAVVGAVRLAMASFVKQTADYAAELTNLSLETGINRDTLVQFGYAGKMVGLDMESMAHGLAHLERQMYSAAQGSAEAGGIFYKLGINVTDSSGALMDVNKVLPQLADAFARTKNPAERTALAMQLLGRGGGRWGAVLAQGSKGLAKYSEEAKALGIQLDGKTLDAGKELEDSLNRVNYAIKGVVYAIGGPLLGKARQMAEALVHWIEINRQLIAQRVHLVFQHINLTMEAMVKAAMYLASNKQLLMWLGAIAALAFAATFPLTALMLLLAGLAEDVYMYLNNPKGTDTLTGSMMDSFDKLTSWLSKKWQKVKDEFNEFTDDPFAYLYKYATKFFDWFVKTARDVPRRVFEVMQGNEKGDGAVGAASDLLKGQGVSGAIARQYVPAPLQALIAYLNRNAPDITTGGTYTPYNPALTVGRGGNSSAPVFAPTMNVYTAPDADGKQIGQDIVKQLDGWWESKTSEAQGAIPANP